MEGGYITLSSARIGATVAGDLSECLLPAQDWISVISQVQAVER